MTDVEMVATRRRRLVAEIARCRERGDRHGVADASASLRILGYLFGTEGSACS